MYILFDIYKVSRFFARERKTYDRARIMGRTVYIRFIFMIRDYISSLTTSHPPSSVRPSHRLLLWTEVIYWIVESVTFGVMSVGWLLGFPDYLIGREVTLPSSIRSTCFYPFYFYLFFSFPLFLTCFVILTYTSNTGQWPCNEMVCIYSCYCPFLMQLLGSHNKTKRIRIKVQ